MAPFAYEFRGNGDGQDRRRERDRERDRGRDRDNQRRRHGDDNRPPNHQFTFRFFPKPTSERPLLSRQRETTPELLGSNQDGQEKQQLKFARPDELTDSDEAEMDESSSEDDGTQPRKKRLVQLAPSAAAVEPPKWSNPDPYTALPPTDVTQTKRPDFVKLIRKARVAATAAGPVTSGDAVTTNEDFISFGAEDDDVADENTPPEHAPSGPKKQQKYENTGAGAKRTRDDQVKVFTGKFGKVSFTPQGDIVSVWKARSSDNQSPWLGMMEPTMHLGTR